MTQLRASMDFVALGLPGDSELRAAAGDVALAHGQLELMLRMTVKSLAGLTIKEALDATQKSKNWELRQEILDIFKSKTKDPSLRMKLKALMGKCSRLSQERNKLLHNAWAISKDGSVVTKGTNHAWGPAPTKEDLTNLASEIMEAADELNEARLYGFIKEVTES